MRKVISFCVWGDSHIYNYGLYHQNTKTDEKCRMRIRECSKPLQKHNVAISGGVRYHERRRDISRCGLPINET